ncbi:MAG: oligogalacturonate lyase family protein [Planctomycetaceae bacterium]
MKGRVLPPESRTLVDASTGRTIRQVTAASAIHHHPFYYLPAYDDAMHWLVFVSHRDGRPALFAEERATGRLVQLTDRDDLNEWSIHPSHDGRWVYFTAQSGAWRVSTGSGFPEECLSDFGDVPMIPPGMVGDAMGTTSLSRDDRWWAVPVRMGDVARLHVIDTASGAVASICEHDSIGHPEFHPDDPSWLRFAGRYTDRIHVIRRDGSGHRLAYARDVARREWVVHESWMPRAAVGGRTEIVTVTWPHGMIGIDVESGVTRRVTSFPAWHPMIRRDGRSCVADTTFPDRGLVTFDPSVADAAVMPLAESLSSNAGSHWNTPHCPYDDGPVRVVAPQHTHPHPSFSPDGSRVVFTSDRTGTAQLYELVIA